VGSIESRLARLEERIAPPADEAAEARERLVRKVWSKTLDAMAHIRRAPIDEPRWRYEVSKLRSKSSFDIACYISALAALGHEDEQEARTILSEVAAEQGVDAAPLEMIIDGMVSALKRIREERA
jgi:hypothetical protein